MNNQNSRESISLLWIIWTLFLIVDTLLLILFLTGKRRRHFTREIENQVSW